MKKITAGLGLQTFTDCDCPCGKGEPNYFGMRLEKYCSECSIKIIKLINNSKLTFQEIKEKLNYKKFLAK